MEREGRIDGLLLRGCELWGLKGWMWWSGAAEARWPWFDRRFGGEGLLC